MKHSLNEHNTSISSDYDFQQAFENEQSKSKKEQRNNFYKRIFSLIVAGVVLFNIKRLIYIFKSSIEDSTMRCHKDCNYLPR